jgi:hypothetical protein
MKWVFAVLVLVNLGFWLWASGVRVRSDELAPTARPTVAADSMKLLNEPGVKLQPRPKPRAEPAPAPVESPALDSQGAATAACFRLGPFLDVATADAAGQVLAELHIGFAREAEEQRRVASHRVFLPPFPSKEAAEAKRKELTRAGFRDHAMIEEGSMQHAISLGVFAVEANARRHIKALGAKGIKASIEPLYQIRTVYALTLRFDLTPGQAQDPAAPLKQRRWEPAEARLSEAACPRSGEIAAKPEPLAAP